jgi:hypothetical protein
MILALIKELADWAIGPVGRVFIRGGIAVALLLWVRSIVWREGWDARDAQARLEAANARAEHDAALAVAQARVREAEYEHAVAIATITKKLERERFHAQAKAARVVADLRAGNLRLREQWRSCASVPAAAADPADPDGTAELRAADAGNLVRAGAECDARIRGLQSVVRQVAGEK